MSPTKDDTDRDLDTKADDLKARLTRPLTITAPTYAYVAAGVMVLALILFAID